jgi:hypothetical protein
MSLLDKAAAAATDTNRQQPIYEMINFNRHGPQWRDVLRLNSTYNEHIDFPGGLLGIHGILHYNYGGQWYPIGDVFDYRTAFHDEIPGVHYWTYRISPEDKYREKYGTFDAYDYEKGKGRGGGGGGGGGGYGSRERTYGRRRNY